MTDLNSPPDLSEPTIGTTQIDIENQLKASDGTIDVVKAQIKLQELQAKSADLSDDELRMAIAIVRILRRTNTGPAAKRKASTKTPKLDITDPDDLLNL